MSRKKTERKITELELNFQDILVHRNPKNRPYVEIFVQEPENVAQENLGTVLGIFEITDESEDSSYIVNYLISIIKKEYFSRAKRGAVESFEAALHKANLALSKLASQGNVNWIGKLNVVCAVCEKNSIHLSQVGLASALLLRGSALADISQKEEEQAEPNPLKTFEDVLSGRLEAGDKLILTTDSIFDIFSLEEIKRSALKFGQGQFVRFLNTALVNELERASVLIVDVAEKKEPEIAYVHAKKTAVDAFSQTAFKNDTPKEDENQKTEERKKLIEELKEELQKEQGGFVDKKTGHIYIKDGEKTAEKQKSKTFNFKKWREKAAQVTSGAREKFRFRLPSVSLPRLPSFQKSILEEKQPEEINPPKTLLGFLPAVEAMKYFLRSLFQKIIPILKLISQKIYLLLRQILPSISRLKETVSRLSYRQKIYSAIALFALILIPLFIIKYQNKAAEEKQPAVEETAPAAPLESDKNVVRLENLENVYEGIGLIDIVNVNGKIFAILKNEIVDFENNKNYSLPENFQNPDLAFVMNDLNLIFLEKEKGILSFSATSGKFQDNAIGFPENGEIKFGGSYLTYGYFLDSKNNQIYRYPRAEGGFGVKTDWLKEALDLSPVKDMAINENVFLAQESGILKLYRGKKQDFTVEETATPIVFEKLYTQRDMPNLYVLDKTNARIIKLDPDGKILAQYYSEEIKTAIDFAADEEKNIIYFSSENSIKKFSIQ